MTDGKEIATFIGGLATGEYDEFLDTIADLVSDRQDKLAGEKRAQIAVGDIVTFTNSVNPKYLAGSTAEVLEIKSNKLVRIKITAMAKTPPMNSRFRIGQTIGCPISVLEVSGSVADEVEKIKKQYA